MTAGFLRGPLAALVFAGITITWLPFHSGLYPYHVSQPSSFKHEVIVTASGLKVDYFFPTLTGSFPTNVNISAVRGSKIMDAVQFLRSASGHRVRRSGWMVIMGHRFPLMRAAFHGLTTNWIEEQVAFASGGYNWRLTASYEPRFVKLRSLMLRMLQSFHAS